MAILLWPQRNDERNETADKGPARMTRQTGQRPAFARQAFGVLVGGIIVEDDMDRLSAATWRSTALRKRMNSRWRWCCNPQV